MSSSNPTPTDYSRLIINSLFSPQPGTSQPRQLNLLSSLISLLAHTFPSQTAQESFIAYVQTFEPVAPNSDQRKLRFLILSGYIPPLSLYPSLTIQLTKICTRIALRDGRLKLHKAKQNANQTFSIGKTWALDDLNKIEVNKVNSTLHFSSEIQC